jgi:hypothetical protein
MVTRKWEEALLTSRDLGHIPRPSLLPLPRSFSRSSITDDVINVHRDRMSRSPSVSSVVSARSRTLDRLTGDRNTLVTTSGTDKKNPVLLRTDALSSSHNPLSSSVSRNPLASTVRRNSVQSSLGEQKTSVKTPFGNSKSVLAHALSHRLGVGSTSQGVGSTSQSMTQTRRSVPVKAVPLTSLHQLPVAVSPTPSHITRHSTNVHLLNDHAISKHKKQSVSGVHNDARTQSAMSEAQDDVGQSKRIINGVHDDIGQQRVINGVHDDIGQQRVMNGVHDDIGQQRVINGVHDGVGQQGVMNGVHDGVGQQGVMNGVHGGVGQQGVMNGVHDNVEQQGVINGVHDAVGQPGVLNGVHVGQQGVMNGVHDDVGQQRVMNEVHDDVGQQGVMNGMHDNDDVGLRVLNEDSGLMIMGDAAYMHMQTELTNMKELLLRLKQYLLEVRYSPLSNFIL